MLAVIAVGYLLAYLVFNRLRDRFGYVGEAEYVIIAFLLGPRVTGARAARVQDLATIVSLGLGRLSLASVATLNSPAAVDVLTRRTGGSPSSQSFN